jgi:orotate phosphoribosyltransferase
MMMPQCPHRIVVAVAVVATAAVPLAVAVATTVKDHHCRSRRNSYQRRM